MKNQTASQLRSFTTLPPEAPAGSRLSVDEALTKDFYKPAALTQALPAHVMIRVSRFQVEQRCEPAESPAGEIQSFPPAFYRHGGSLRIRISCRI